MIPDVNVLVAAFRGDHAHHELARCWIEQARAECASGAESFVLLPAIAVSFLRLVTNSRVFVRPDEPAAAASFLDALLTSPGVEWREGGDWSSLRSRILGLELRGNLVSDGWIAAATQSLGEHLVTFDEDFRRLLPTGDVTILAT